MPFKKKIQASKTILINFLFEKCGGQKQSKKAGRPFKINFSLDIRIIQFIYLMYEVRTPQWETQTTNLWKQDYINIISNNYYTLFPWWWDSEIRKNLSTLLFFFFFGSLFLIPPSFLIGFFLPLSLQLAYP